VLAIGSLVQNKTDQVLRTSVHLKRETAAKSRRQLALLIVRQAAGVNARDPPEQARGQRNSAGFAPLNGPLAA
jgi:hypothetical protein